MRKTIKEKRVKIMPIWMGILVFVLAFGAGVASKFAIQPGWTKEYNVPWSDELGTRMVDLPYGDGEANKFDLYLPADSGKGNYGLVVYLHAGGFTAGDKSGDVEMLSWLCKKGYVAAGINYTLFAELEDGATNGASVLTQSNEIRDAVPKVIEAAEKEGYHIDSMAIAGGSAGHALAMIYAYRDAGQAPVPVKMTFGAVGPSCFCREDWDNYGFDRETEESYQGAAGIFSAMLGEMLSIEEIKDGSYLEKMNPISAAEWITLIAQIIIKCKELFPIWVKWEYIKSLFVMPNGDKETGITGEQTKFKQFYNLYPFQTYINWKPVDAGNILYNDAKFLTWLYKSHGDSFREYEFVSDASQLGKYNIHSFIQKAQKIDIVVDCENSDPYKTEAMIKSLSPEEKFSVQRILLFDDVNANKAWQFVSSIIEIPVKRIVVERVSRLKSQVDMRLAVEVCKEFYENEVDSFILMTSDSDYWSLIASLPSASFIVVIEDGQTSKRLIQTYEEHKIPYCWLDDFCMGRAMELKQLALKSEINNRLKSMCKINFAYMIENSSRAIWTTFSESEKIEILKSCKKGLRASIDSDGNLALCIE